MSKTLFDHDPLTGMTIWWHENELTGEVAFEYEQDVEPILEENKALQNMDEVTKQGFKNEFWRYASIPNGIQMKWLLEEGLDVYDKNAWPQVMRKLNDPEYRHLKTTGKYHSRQNIPSIIIT